MLFSSVFVTCVGVAAASVLPNAGEYGAMINKRQSAPYPVYKIDQLVCLHTPLLDRSSLIADPDRSLP